MARVAKDFYYKGWRGESDATTGETQNFEDQFQFVVRAASSGKGLRWALQQLLESGGDERSVTDPNTGLTKYHTPTLPAEGIFRSSCTSNVVTEDAFGRGVDTLRQLLLEAKNMSKQKNHDMVYSSPEDLFRKLLCDIRERLRAIFELSFEDTISLFPSGTDAELMPALLGFTRANSQNARGTATFTVVTAAGEVGSGTTLAAVGKHFAKLLPSGRESLQDDSSIFWKYTEGGTITGADLYMRNEKGELLESDERDRLVREKVDRAAAAVNANGRFTYGCIIVHMVVGSKTGQCMPSESCMDAIMESHGHLVLPVVDACQGRLSEGSIRRYLDKGRVVLCTGSKFFGGPAFSGVCLLSDSMAQELEVLLMKPQVEQMLLNSALKEYVSAPLMSDDLPKLRSLLPQRPLNYGVLMRWMVALHGMEAYYAEVPQAQRARLLSSWTRSVRKLIKEKNTPLVKLLADESQAPTACEEEDEQRAALSTIVSFHCRCNRGTPDAAADTMTVTELRRVQLLMATDLSREHSHLSLLGSAKVRCFIGQPVDLSPNGGTGGKLNVLRIAASAPLMVRAWHEGLDPVVAEDQALLEKLMLILGNWSLFQQQSAKV
mmetsp:Transcript_24032/g.66836  ORF Transcript_24032/g.66836 Transcript_24032/m.66836 type:complete len:605 (+) Transcript_24032:87-1901(+)